MHEALTALIPIAARQLELQRIRACYLPHNARSGRLLQRLGFEIEGYAQDMMWVQDRWRDHIMTSLTLPSPDFLHERSSRP